MGVDHPPSLTDGERRELLRVARRTLARHLDVGESPRCRTDSTALLEPRASFVTLRRRESGTLRGCRGERLPQQPLIQSVSRMVVAAAIDDPRFDPVTAEEEPLVTIEISALGPMRPIRPEQIVLGRHGLTLVSGDRLALLLPSVPVSFGWRREQFLGALCRKARLPEDAWKEPASKLFAFETECWGEETESAVP